MLLHRWLTLLILTLAVSLGSPALADPAGCLPAHAYENWIVENKIDQQGYWRAAEAIFVGKIRGFSKRGRSVSCGAGRSCTRALAIVEVTEYLKGAGPQTVGVEGVDYDLGVQQFRNEVIAYVKDYPRDDWSLNVHSGWSRPVLTGENDQVYGAATCINLPPLIVGAQFVFMLTTPASHPRFAEPLVDGDSPWLQFLRAESP